MIYLCTKTQNVSNVNDEFVTENDAQLLITIMLKMMHDNNNSLENKTASVEAVLLFTKINYWNLLST